MTHLMSTVAYIYMLLFRHYHRCHILENKKTGNYFVGKKRNLCGQKMSFLSDKHTIHCTILPSGTYHVCWGCHHNVSQLMTGITWSKGVRGTQHCWQAKNFFENECLFKSHQSQFWYRYFSFLHLANQWCIQLKILRGYSTTRITKAVQESRNTGMTHGHLY